MIAGRLRPRIGSLTRKRNINPSQSREGKDTHALLIALRMKGAQDELLNSVGKNIIETKRHIFRKSNRRWMNH